MENCYIGALHLRFADPEWFYGGKRGKLFEDPILDPETEVVIDTRYAAAVNTAGSEGGIGTNPVVWLRENTEYRLYDICDGAERCILSEKQGNRVTVTAVPGIHTKRGLMDPWGYIHLEELLLDASALILHSAGIEYLGKAILFTAPSETGKTTQTNLWNRFRPGVSDINGDRNVLQKTRIGWYACGFPLCGSSERCEQKAVRVGLIAYVVRDSRDWVEELRPAKKASLLYAQCTVPSCNRYYAERSLNLLDELLREVPVVALHCTMNESAVDVLDEYRKGL